MKYKENTEEELRNTLRELFNGIESGQMTEETFLEGVKRIVISEYNRGYAEGYTIAYEEHA